MVGDGDGPAGAALRDSTGDGLGDRIVRGLIGVFEQAFPGRVRGYYLRGSYASGTGTAGSDLDLFVVFADRLERAEAQRARDLAGYCDLLSPVLLEIIVVGEQQLRRVDNTVIALNLKLATRLLYGQDIRGGLPDLDVGTYRREVVHAPYHTYAYARGSPVLTYPLDHIDPDDPCYGFDRLPMPGPDGYPAASAKLLVATVCWTATALVVLSDGVYVRDKADAVAGYRTRIADEWTGLVVRVYELCRDRWHYRVPPDEAGRSELRALCERTLGFQNHFLARYRDHQLTELRSGVAGRQVLAAQRLGQIRFPDPEVVGALRDLRRAGEPEVRRAAARALDGLVESG